MLIWTESYEAVRGASDATIATKYNAVGSNNANTTMPLVGFQQRTGTLSGNIAGTHIIDLVGTDQDDLLIVGHARKWSSSTNGDVLQLKGDAGSTHHLTVKLFADGSIVVYRGASDGTGTVIGSAPAGTVTLSSSLLWYYIEVKARLNDSVGTVEVRIDGTTKLTITGADTKNAGTAGVFDQAVLGLAAYQDDLYICNEQGSSNADFLGPVHIEGRLPNGNGATSNGVGSDGNSTDNYLLVDEAFTGGQTGWGSDYVDLASTGDKDTYTYQDSTFPTGNSVKGVMVWTHADKTDAGVRSFQPVARLSGTETNGATCTLLNGSFRTLGAVFETKPGGGAWTVADVNSTEFGMVAST